jgi:cytochrome c556
MSKKIVALASVAVAAATLSLSAAAQTPQERAIQYRQGIFKGMGWHMGNMTAQVKGEKPYNKDDFLKSATFVDQLGRMPWEGFGPGTDKGAPTKAKADIWSDQTKFREAQNKLAGETSKLVQAASTGNMDQIKGQFGAVGGACKNCHDSFRAQ